MWLESKYMNLLSSRLLRFTKRNNGFNFRCPFCGDSERSKTKARGWVYQDQGKLKFHCFNCDLSLGFKKFLSEVDQELYRQYRLESLVDSKTPEQKEFESFVEKMKPKAFITNSPLKGLKKVSQLSPDHPVKKYVVSRLIPTPYHAKLFLCPNFMGWINTIIPSKFEEDSLLNHDETRLLIPFINKKNEVHAVQGRSLNPNSKTKYITVIFDDDTPKVWGLDDVDFNKYTYVFEGPIDAMFVSNSLATAGGDLASTLRSFNKERIVIVYDNEPRSKETVNKIDKAIMNGYAVCIWPENLEYKDVNEMRLGGLSSEFIEHIIKQNTFRDLAAKMRLAQWSKCDRRN